MQFGAEFLAGDAVRLEYIKQVGRREMQNLVGEILDRAFLVGLQFALGYDTREGLIILVDFRSNFLTLGKSNKFVLLSLNRNCHNYAAV